MCEPGTETEDPEERRGRCRLSAPPWGQRGAKAFLCSKRSVADALLGFAKDGNADLIVAGAYGHSRLGEWMFGGVTQELLAKSQLCCLFSH